MVATIYFFEEKKTSPNNQKHSLGETMRHKWYIMIIIRHKWGHTGLTTLGGGNNGIKKDGWETKKLPNESRNAINKNTIKEYSRLHNRKLNWLWYINMTMIIYNKYCRWWSVVLQRFKQLGTRTIWTIILPFCGCGILVSGQFHLSAVKDGNVEYLRPPSLLSIAATTFIFSIILGSH